MLKKEVLKKNLQALESNSNHIITPLDPSTQKYQIVRDKDNMIVANDKNYIRYNNSLTDIAINDLDFNHRGIYFILGLFDVGAIEKIYNNSSRDSIIFVVEPHPEVFYYMITNYELAELFAKKNFFLLVADFECAPQYFNEYILKKSFIVKASNLQFYTSKYLQAFEKDTFKLQKRFIESIRSALFMIGNSTEDTMIGLLQNLLNLKKFCSSMSICKLENKYNSMPAVVVSAGPSLQKNIQYLKRAPRTNILIFAVDTVLEKLLNMGIIPDAVFTIERPKIVYEYFYENVEIPDELVFVGPPVVYPGILNKFNHDRIIFPLKQDEKINEWLNYLVSNKADLIPTGSSVAHLAFSFARYLGCDPIIFIGQDLAYGEDGSTHTRGSIYDNKKIEREEDELCVEGYYGNKVKTKRTWRNFQIWFEEEFYKTKQLIINSTEGGVRLKHTKQLTLEQSLNEYATKKRKPLFKIIDELYEPLFEEKNIIYDKIMNEANSLRKFSLLMQSLLEKLDKIENNINKATNDKHNNLFFNQLAQYDNKYKDSVVNLGFFSIFVQTHIAIAAFELNKLERKSTIDNIKKIIFIQRKLFSISKELSNLVENELKKFLKTNFKM